MTTVEGLVSSSITPWAMQLQPSELVHWGLLEIKKIVRGESMHATVVVVGLWYANNTYYLYQICNTHPFLPMPLSAASRPEAPSEGDRDKGSLALPPQQPYASRRFYL